MSILSTPPPTQPLTDKKGTVTSPWYRFITSIVERVFFKVNDGDGFWDQSPSGGELLIFHPVDDGENFLTITNAQVQDGGFLQGLPALGADGADDDIDVLITAKGDRGLIILTPGGSTNSDDLDGLNIVTRTTNAAHGAAGFGTSIVFDIENDAGGDPLAGNITCRWTSAVAGSESAEYRFLCTINGAHVDEFFIGNGVSVGSANLSPGNGNLGFPDGKGIFDANANEVMLFETVASAVNYWDVFNSATGNAVVAAVAGGDSDIDMEFDTKGEGAFQFVTPGGSTIDDNIGGIVLTTRSTGTVASGFGTDYKHVLENASGTDVTAYRVLTIWNDPTAASEDSTAAFSVKSGGADLTVLTLGPGVQVGSPTGGDKGAGTINAAGDIYKNNSAYTNPDYALEHYFTGEIVEFADNEGADDYPGIIPLNELEGKLRSGLRLPGITDEPMGTFARSDILLEKLEEAYCYIIELHKRVRALEGKADA